MFELQFKLGEETLRGHLHSPSAPTGAAAGILIIPGFADTAVGPHNMHVAMARALAGAGFAVLRFDYRGQGESDGDFRRFTAQSGLDDARRALAALRTRPGVDASRLAVIGFSLGGALACELAAEHREIEALALLAPVAYPQKVFRAFFTDQQLAEAEAQGWMDWLGWSVGSAFLPSLAGLDPLAALTRSQAAALVIHGTADTEVPPSNGEAYAAHGAAIEWLKGGDHQFSSTQLQDEAIRLTRSWLQSHWHHAL
jgi:pimeloyl-ACP methyl ester carboxylesterase